MAIDKVTTEVIADDAVTQAKVANDAVGSDELASDIALTGNFIKFPVHATTAARNSAIGSPSAGMMIYNTAEKSIQQHTGSGWISLTPSPSIGTTTHNVTGGTYVKVGDTIKITGSNLGPSGATVTIGGVAATSISHTVPEAEITCVVPTLSSASHNVVVTSSVTGISATKVNGITISADPSWASNAGDITMEYTQGNRVTNGEGTEGTTTYQSELFLATSSSVTVTQALSGVPDPIANLINLVQHSTPANGYYLETSGNATLPAVENNTTYNFNIVATETTENQQASLAVSLTVLVNFFGYGGTP